MAQRHPITFLSLSSGSCGNCYYLECNGTSILVDAGVGIRSVERWMTERGFDLASVSAILLTHDHTDHTKAVGSLSKKYKIPVYATTATIQAVMMCPSITTKIDNERVFHLSKCESVKLGDFSIEAFPLPHDAADSIGFRIEVGDRVFVFMTDLGFLPSSAVKYVESATHLIIESNYDKDMLVESSYPLSLQMRIDSDRGHLCNSQTAKYLSALYHDGLERIWLCHLSQECNTPSLALKATTSALRSAGIGEGDVEVVALPRKEPSEIYIIK